ncbi:11S globulin seed storage protein Ana o 2.0101-like [Euphorbia lathyris]|uniref:11S globulin seed storage protein Ana o 2.0101-like n=1 Tax=Euphorbia lathyris TaxID=212925 RepID=UPI0033131EC1
MAYVCVCCLFFLLHSFVAISSKTNCQVSPHLFAREPDIYIPTEAGSTEIWTSFSDEFQCIGVQVVRYTIKPNRHALPLYINADELSFIVQGKLMFGLIIPECSQELDGEKSEYHMISHLQSGDVLAYRAGETFWGYNDGNENFIATVISRTSNTDPLRMFCLGGPQNILGGLSLEFTTKAFNINNELATKLQRKIGRKHNTICVTESELHLSNSPTTQPYPKHDQQEGNGSYNVNDGSSCNINTRIVKISDPLRADLFMPEVGHFTTIDVHQLPILESSQLSISYNFLLKDVMRLPHWENSYTIFYVMKGEGHIQIVNDSGKNVFDDIIKEGQLLPVPHSFLIAEQAKSEKFEYVTFKTNANPITSELSGRNSVINYLPLEVLENAFKINKEEAKEVKFGRKEKSLAKSYQNIS